MRGDSHAGVAAHRVFGNQDVLRAYRSLLVQRHSGDGVRIGGPVEQGAPLLVQHVDHDAGTVAVDRIAADAMVAAAHHLGAGVDITGDLRAFYRRTVSTHHQDAPIVVANLQAAQLDLVGLHPDARVTPVEERVRLTSGVYESDILDGRSGCGNDQHRALAVAIEHRPGTAFSNPLQGQRDMNGEVALVGPSGQFQRFSSASRIQSHAERVIGSAGRGISNA